MARRVRPQHLESPLPDQALELSLDLCSGLVDLGKAAGGEDEMANPLVGAFAHRLGRDRRGQDNHRHVDVPRQRGDGGADVDPQDLSPLGIDGVHLARITVCLNVLDHLMARLSGHARSADNGHARRFEKWYQFMSHHISPSRVSSGSIPES